jgi:hypothetical protein
MNKWGSLVKKKTFKKKRREKKSSSVLCFDHFIWCKGSISWKEIKEYEGLIEEKPRETFASTKRRKKKEFEKVIQSINDEVIDNEVISLTEGCKCSTPPENITEMCKLGPNTIKIIRQMGRTKIVGMIPLPLVRQDAYIVIFGTD